MNILIIRPHPSYLAVTNATYNVQELGLARALVKKGHVCDILFAADKQEETIKVPVGNGGEIRVFYRRGIALFKSFIFTNCDDLYEQYDILQTAEYNQIQSWYLAGKYSEKTVIYHGPYYCKLNKRYNLTCSLFDLFCKGRYIRLGTKFIAKSVLARDFLVKKGILPQNITVAGVGVDLDAFVCESDLDKDALLREIERDNSELKLLYVGRFDSKRNITFIIDIFRSVLMKNESARLYMIGTGKKQYLQKVFAYVQSCGIQDKVIWQEKIKQNRLPEIYKKVDYFLLPTKYEIFGMVLLEAMLYGVVVLTTFNGGAVTLIKNGENGIVLEDKFVDEWAEQIVSLNYNNDKKMQIQKLATKTISEKYTWDKIVELFENSYSSKLANKRNSFAEE